MLVHILLRNREAADEYEDWAPHVGSCKSNSLSVPDVPRKYHQSKAAVKTDEQGTMTGKNRIDFHGAAMRHYSDAEFLREDRRGANAGQLYGFVAECGIKALLVASGLPVEADGDIKKGAKKATDFRKHVNELVSQINMAHSFLEGRTMAGYLAHIPDIVEFCNWSTDHRYYDEAQIPPSLEKWRTAALQVMKMLDVAKSDGKL